MAGSRRAYTIVFLLVVAFILYGSLYPFQFHARPTETGPFAYLLSTWRDWDHGTDLLSNILLYIPFGVFGTCAFGRWAAPPILLAAAALAAGVELAQFHDQGRVTSMGDVYADAIGGGVGAMFAIVVGAGARRTLILLPLLIAAEFAGRVLIINATLKLADSLGAGLAFAMWLLLRRMGRTKFAFLAVAFAGMIIVARLQPFAFQAAPGTFGWVPFVSFLSGSVGVAIQAFCGKFFQYGGLIWLLHRAGMRIDTVTILTAALLFVTSWAETYLPGRSAETTDAVMALTIGGVFALLAGRQSRPP